MKTLQEQFNLIQEGKGHKDMFLKSARRLFPEYITNFATYGEATKILKQRGILNEAVGGVVTQRTFDPFKAFGAYVNEEYNVATGVGPTYASQQENPIKAPKPVGSMETKAVNSKLSKEIETKQKETGFEYRDKELIDNLYGEEFLEGYYAEMKDPKNAEKTIDELKEIVRKNLVKNPSFYVENAAFGIKGIGYTKDVAGLGEGEPAKGKYKASGYGDIKK
jgi:DNA-binding transcriptional MocR family regulator